MSERWYRGWVNGMSSSPSESVNSWKCGTSGLTVDIDCCLSSSSTTVESRAPSCSPVKMTGIVSSASAFCVNVNASLEPKNLQLWLLHTPRKSTKLAWLKKSPLPHKTVERNPPVKVKEFSCTDSLVEETRLKFFIAQQTYDRRQVRKFLLHVEIPHNQNEKAHCTQHWQEKSQMQSQCATCTAAVDEVTWPTQNSTARADLPRCHTPEITQTTCQTTWSGTWHQNRKKFRVACEEQQPYWKKLLERGNARVRLDRSTLVSIFCFFLWKFEFPQKVKRSRSLSRISTILTSVLRSPHPARRPGQEPLHHIVNCRISTTPMAKVAERGEKGTFCSTV